LDPSHETPTTALNINGELISRSHMTKMNGSCLCGSVRYSVNRAPVQVVACHCNLCRRMTGAPFSVYVVARSADLQVEDQNADLRQHQVTERTTRSFCGKCGTPLFNSNAHDYPGLRMLYLGTTEAPERHLPAMEIFCESKLPWVELGTLCTSHALSPHKA
jgi:hypothetical protein